MLTDGLVAERTDHRTASYPIPAASVRAVSAETRFRVIKSVRLWMIPFALHARPKGRGPGARGPKVFAERLSQMDECRTDSRGDSVDLLREFSEQTGKKRGRVCRRSFTHLRINVFGDLLDREEDGNAEVAAEQGHIIIGDFKTVGARQAGARERRTGVSPSDFAEPVAP